MIKLNKIESLFFHVLEDLKDYLYDLTLVGGWVPYVYSRFLWNNVLAKPVTKFIVLSHPHFSIIKEKFLLIEKTSKSEPKTYTTCILF